MNTRCVSELLLRPATFCRPLHTISTTPIWQRAPALRIPHRCINTTTSSQAAQAKPQSNKEIENAPKPTSTDPYADLFPINKTNPSFASNNTNPPAAGKRVFGSPIRDNRQRLRKDGLLSSQPTSSDELNAAHVNHSYGADWFKTPVTGDRRPGLSFEDMNVPNGMITPGPTAPAIREQEPVYPRLNPAYGRTVTLAPKRGRDLVRGISMLGSLMSRNQVRKDHFKQRFHERPGLKRKRLNSERWRKRFKIGFNATCARVMELTRKGW